MRVVTAKACFGIQHLIAVGIFAQAVLAGLFLYVDPELVAVHNLLGTVLVVLGGVLLLASLRARFETRHALVPLAATQFLVLALQHALGILGRGGGSPAALHIPNAFLLFTVAMLWLVRARRALEGSR